jgi:phage tail sheath protein FI
VRDTIREFLRAQWRAGALLGQKEEQAFFVACDRTTMTEDDILNGRLICEIGVAPLRPAEFVIFRIFQRTAESQT